MSRKIKANVNFYDIESLSNVFTLCNFKNKENILEVYYLVDDDFLVSSIDFYKKARERIYEKNKNFDGSIEFYDLSEKPANDKLAETFGVSDAKYINNPNNYSQYPSAFRITCTTDPNYDGYIHPYLMGYNSYNYDTTMLAQYFHEVYLIRSNMVQFNKTTARQMREYNDLLFSPKFKKQMPSMLAHDPKDPHARPDYSDSRWLIRKNMLMSGRHIDVARLNEKQSRVGLKRLLGMLGYQILESDKLGTNVSRLSSEDEFLDLIAYNTSDVVNLELLFNHKNYQGQFTLKKRLLETYPETIYEKNVDSYTPNISPETVRRDALTIDSSSAQFATKVLCPYGHLKDMPTVSFKYPSDMKVKELLAQGEHVNQVNVLEESRKFFYQNFTDPKIRAEFDKVYYYYKNIEGKNFNASDNYMNDFGDGYGNLPQNLEPYSLFEIAKTDTNIYYFNKDGSPSSCFVTFSTGGIHGAEYNKALYEYDLALWEQDMKDMAYVKSVYNDPLELRRAKKITMPDGRELKYNLFIKSSATIKAMEKTEVSERANLYYKDFEKDKPELFKAKDDGSTKINNKYVFTSNDLTNHEDFKSYYPNLLRMMSAFYNHGLGYDRYGEIFDNKEKYGKLMKDKSLDQKDRDMYAILREGTKLILNSASGAGDTNFESSIRMNNTIISMRIIG